jgi:hypothetical protein
MDGGALAAVAAAGTVVNWWITHTEARWTCPLGCE